MRERVLAAFEAEYGSAAGVVVRRAPGRTNIIGGHVDYSGGLVLPVAINRYVWMAARGRTDGTVRLFSVNFDARFQTTCDAIDRRTTPQWAAYILGVILELQRLGAPVTGCDIAFCGDVPTGSGLSSSAALEVCTAATLLDMTNTRLPPLEVVSLCRRAENLFVGVNCGIMDQFASYLCRKDHALLINCKTLESEQIPLNLGTHTIVMVDTRKERKLASSAYNERVEQVARAAAFLRRYHPAIELLGDATEEQVRAHADEMEPAIFRRALHVVTEIARVRETVFCLKSGDVPGAGAILYRSHDSLRDLYEVSCDELDFVVNFCRQFNGVAGARLTGGGFGGCVIVLIERSRIAEFAERLQPSYTARFGHPAGFIGVESVDGAAAESA